MHGKVGFGKDRMCSYKHTHNSAVHTGKTFSKVAKYLRWGGIGFNIVSGSVELNRFLNSDKSFGDAIKLGVVGASIGLTYAGGPLTVLGIGVGIADAYGQFDWFYRGADFQQYVNFGGDSNVFYESSFNPK